MKSKILFVMHMPPPVHGAAMMGKYIHDSKIINQSFDCHYFNLTLARDLNDIGKGGIRKLVDLGRQLTNIYKQVKILQPAFCYVTPSAKGGAFYKDFLVVMLLKLMGRKVVIHYHNKGVATRQDRLLDNALYRRFFKNIKVILLAESLYRDVRKYVDREDVYVCANGIPASGAVTKDKKFVGGEMHLLFLSNMMEEKGVWELYKACALLKQKGLAVKCHFVGKWSDVTEEEFRNVVAHDGMEDCVFAYGAKYGEEKNEFFEKANVFVFPTYYNNECFPLVLLEAMEQGLPCISTYEGGIPDIVEDGVTGYVVNQRSASELAEKIEYLITHPELCESMGKAGKEKFLQEFTLERFESRMKDILEDITAKS